MERMQDTKPTRSSRLENDEKKLWRRGTPCGGGERRRGELRECGDGGAAQRRGTRTSTPATKRRTTKSAKRSKLTPSSSAMKRGPGLDDRDDQGGKGGGQVGAVSSSRSARARRGRACAHQIVARDCRPHADAALTGCLTPLVSVVVWRHGGCTWVGCRRTHPRERDGVEDGKAEVDGDVGAGVEEAGGVAGAGFLPGHLLGGGPWRGGVGGARAAAEQRCGVAAVAVAVAVAVRPRHSAPGKGVRGASDRPRAADSDTEHRRGPCISTARRGGRGKDGG